MTSRLYMQRWRGNIPALRDTGAAGRRSRSSVPVLQRVVYMVSGAENVAVLYQTRRMGISGLMSSSELESLTNRLVTENKDSKCKPLFQKTNTKYRKAKEDLS